MVWCAADILSGSTLKLKLYFNPLFWLSRLWIQTPMKTLTTSRKCCHRRCWKSVQTLTECLPAMDLHHPTHPQRWRMAAVDVPKNTQMATKWDWHLFEERRQGEYTPRDFQKPCTTKQQPHSSSFSHYSVNIALRPLLFWSNYQCPVTWLLSRKIGVFWWL